MLPILSFSPKVLSYFSDNPGLMTLSHVISGAETNLRLVGGCVRDALLDQPFTDIDFVTLYTPDQIVTFLEKAKVSYGTMGLKFGTVKAFIKGHSYDITTCRQDTGQDGRWTQVVYTTNWKDDSRRRDFTFNALYLTLEGSIEDFHGGINDLKEGRIRFIGDPAERLMEDRLRLLRYFRFWVKYGKQPLDSALFPLFQQTCQHLDILSPERVQGELLKILQASSFQWAEVLPRLTAIGLWEGLFKINTVHEALALKAPSPLGRLWALCKENLNMATKRLNLSRLQQVYLNHLGQAYDQKDATPFAILDQYGESILKDWAALRDYKDDLPLSVPSFPLTGKDLIALGLKGSLLGDTLLKVRTWWRHEQGKPSHQACLSYVKELVKTSKDEQ